MMLICLKNSDGRYRGEIKKSNGFRSAWKRQLRPVALNMLFRRQERWLRPRQRRKLKSRSL